MRRAVGTLRRILLAHRALAVVLLAMTLCLKLVVPAGYMLQAEGRVLSVTICSDGMDRQATIALPGSGGDHREDSQAGKANGSCPFAGHGSPLLAGADPALLVLALAFILALGFADQAIPRLRRLTHLRPPLRGPPAAT